MAQNTTSSPLMDENRSLPPWKAFVGLVICGAMAVGSYHMQWWSQACALSAVAGMFLQDWAYRLRDKYDPDRIMGDGK